MGRQTLRDWVHRFNEQGPDGLTNKEGAGRPRLITDEQMQELAKIVEAGPDPQIDGVVRWQQIDLVRIIKERCGQLSERTWFFLHFRPPAASCAGSKNHR